MGQGKGAAGDEGPAWNETHSSLSDLLVPLSCQPPPSDPSDDVRVCERARKYSIERNIFGAPTTHDKYENFLRIYSREREMEKPIGYPSSHMLDISNFLREKLFVDCNAVSLGHNDQEPK